MAYTKIMLLSAAEGGTFGRAQYCDDREEGKFYKKGLGADPNHAEQDFADVRVLWGKNDPNDPRMGYDLIQSLDPEQSKKIDLKNMNLIGQDLVRRLCPEHQAVVYTHNDAEDGNAHNHILINSVNMYTGQKLHVDKTFMHEMRRISDEICLANGLDNTYLPLLDSMSQTEVNMLRKNNYLKNKAAKLRRDGKLEEAKAEESKIKRIWKSEIKMSIARAASVAHDGHEFAASLARDGIVYDVMRGDDGRYHAMYFDTVSHRSISESTLNKECREMRADGITEPRFSTANLNKLLARNRPELVAEVTSQQDFDRLPQDVQQKFIEVMCSKYEKTVRQNMINEGKTDSLSFMVTDNQILKASLRSGVKLSLMATKTAAKTAGYVIKAARITAKPLQALPVIGNFSKAADSAALAAEKGIETGARSIKEPQNKGGSKNSKKSQGGQKRQKPAKPKANLVRAQHIDSGAGGESNPQKINWADIPPAKIKEIQEEEERKAEKRKIAEEDEAAWNRMCATLAQLLNEQEQKRAARKDMARLTRQREEQDTEPAERGCEKERVRSKNTEEEERER